MYFLSVYSEQYEKELKRFPLSHFHCTINNRERVCFFKEVTQMDVQLLAGIGMLVFVLYLSSLNFTH